MLNNWFLPAKVLEGIEFENSNTASFGNSIKNISEYEKASHSPQLALIGYHTEIADEVRKQLLRLGNPWKDLPLYDIGNIRKPEPSFTIQAIKAVLSMGLFPIIIGGEDSINRILYEAFQDYNKRINLALISDRFPFLSEDSDYWSGILRDEFGHLHQFNILAHQSHFLMEEDKNFISEWALDEMGLGNIRALPSSAEPNLRNAELVSINMNAVRYADCPQQSNPNPNGLFGEELCQLARYAGMSDKTVLLGIAGISPSVDHPTITCQLAAQVIWYYIDGMLNRKMDYPVSSRHLTEYMVDLKHFDEQISFWKSTLTGRWWVQVPAKEKGDKMTTEMIPCLYEDYLQAGQEEISERLFRAIKRLG